jgi:hypothetical protein
MKIMNNPWTKLQKLFWKMNTEPIKKLNLFMEKNIKKN